MTKLGSDKTRNKGNGNGETEIRKWKWGMHEGNTLILYYLTVEKPMVMNTQTHAHVQHSLASSLA